MTQTPDIWMLHTTNPREGESAWGGCYIVEADAHNDAATMRKVTGLDWSVVPMVRTDSIGKCLHQIAEPAAAPQAVQAAVPVGGQSRFNGEKDWQWCSPEHVAMVLATPSEWQGYEVRYLYAAPAHPAEGVPAQAESKIGDLLALARNMVHTALEADNKTEVKEMKAAIEAEVNFERALRAALAATHSSPQGLDALTPAARDVLAERQRQVKQEGYDPEHDDGHVNDEIAAMAAIFVMPEAARDWDARSTSYGNTLAEALLPADWNFPRFGNRRDQLVKGTAMALAEIERIDRGACHA